MILVDPPVAPFDIIYDADTSDSIVTITPPSSCQRMYLDAPGDTLDGWNKKKQSGSHTVWSTRNPTNKTGVIGIVRILNAEADSIYVTDTNGTNKGLTLVPSGITKDTSARTITEEFILQCDNTGKDISVVSDGSSASGWSQSTGTVTSITSESGRIKVVGQGDSNGLKVYKLLPADITTFDFISFEIECSVNKNLYFMIGNTADTKYKYWRGSRFPITANTRTTFVLPLKSPQGTTGSLPTTVTATPPDYLNDGIYIGTDAADASPITFYLDNIQLSNGTWAKVEVCVPDNLKPTSSSNILSSCVSGAYTVFWSPQLDTTYANVSSNNANLKLMDGTAIVDVAATISASRAVYLKGVGGQTKTPATGNSGNITYSSEKGISRRLGFAFYLGPSGSSSGINKLWLKIVTNYEDKNGITVPDLSGHNNNGTIISSPIKLSRGLRVTHTGSEANDGRISFGNSPAFIRRDGSFTVFGRLKINNSQHGNLIGQWYAGNASNSAFNLYISLANMPAFMIAQGSSTKSLNSTGTITSGTEVFLAGKFDTNTGKIYIRVNDTTDETATTLTGINSPNTPLYIGGYQSLGLDADIYQVCYVPRAMSDDELTAAKSGTIPQDAIGLWMPAIEGMGSSTFEFTPNSSDNYTGLTNMGNWLAFERPDKRVELYLFSRKLANLSVTEDHDGYITKISLGLKKGTKVARTWIRYPDFDADVNSDSTPNFIDRIVEIENKFVLIE